MNGLQRLLRSVVPPVFGIAFALCLVEIGIRVFLSPNQVVKTWSDRPTLYFGASGAPTLQGFPHAQSKPPNTFRIAVVGDSFTFAPYMQFTDAFPSKLGVMLNLNNSTERGEVINYGIPAYSTSHEIRVVERAITEAADLVVLQITLNDPEIKAHRPTGILEDMVDRFAPKKPTGALAVLSRYWKTLDFALGRIYNTQSHQAYIKYFNDLYENPKSWNLYEQSMRKIAAICKSNNKPLVAVVFPLFGIAMDKNYPFYPIHEKIAALLSSLDIPHLDLSTKFSGIPLERLQVIPGVDRHPNEIAHRMAAEEIYLWLESKSLIPEPLRISNRYATRLGVENQRPWVAK